jgi:23S rRNA (pseudouridine1915-N3)-methyltransferase
MQFRVIVAGKPALPYTKTAVEDYLKRLTRHGNYELIIVKAGDKEAVSERLLQASAGCYRIALDERGITPTSRELADKFDSMKMAGEIKTIACLIGAADGHTPELRSQCHLILSLSSLTMQHEIALVVLLEQLYRIETIHAGSPYHRD